MHALDPSPTSHRPLGIRIALPLLAFAVVLALLSGCRASGGGPSTPARNVAAFFAKYRDRPGFRTTEWSADFLQRLALVRVGKLLGGNDLTNAITGIRTARVMTFLPTTGSAQSLVREGLNSEVSGLLQAERYTSLANSATGAAPYQYVVKANGDQVSELVATGTMPDALGSFVLVQVQGNFTRAQADALSQVLPEVVQQTAGN
ncbi:DUF4252 domain-containing protein [Hymenobacter sp. UV11]|uniref:DUF4252 domain-containing protein n=1 Tax=Hymenobacter sp. UV11 TaxID=1849735 RepID=UPI00105C844E|nr:DUF4252 domain-containing protein [Hymenobacter sp. UV11]TDN38368.1 hypothetical protein A8B98_23705 [Hymenobacter sp. UV11]TFZ68034.1 DUF4252 domain-containing protein [Hymenobacter sp. UV11]